MWLPAKLSTNAHLPPRHPSPHIKQLELHPCALLDILYSMENTQHFSDIWNEAVDKYKSKTKSDSLPLDSLGTADSVEAILTAIAGNRKDFEDGRAKGKSLRDVLKPVVKIVQQMAEVAGEGANLAFAPGKTIFVAIGILLKVSDAVSKSYDSVIDIFESLESFLGRLTIYLEHEILPLMKEVIVKILAHLLSILGVATRLIREHRAVTYFKTLIGKNSKVQAALEKLDKLTAQEGRAVATATLSAASEILSQLETRMNSDRQDVKAIKTMLMKIAQETGAISASSQENRIMLEGIREYVMQNTEKILPYLSNHHRSEVHKWLSAPSPVSNKEDNGSMRQAGTGLWFIQSEKYKQWKTQSNSLLWVSGGPGSGKSVLSSTIISDIEFDSKVDSSVLLAYFYFDFRDPRKEHCLGLISSLVDQLASRCSEMPAALEQLYAIHRDGMERPTLHKLVTALKEMIMNITCSVYIVIDALDECSERKNLMALIEQITKWNLNNLHMLLTSRKEEELNHVLLPLSAEVNLKSSLVDRDIAFHVRAVLRNDPDLSKWQPPQMLEIETSLTRGAHGMFRWVSCQLDSIRRCRNAPDLKECLDTLPKTLYDTYDRILKHIDDQDFKYVHATLQWLAFSKRPVQLKEVAEVLAMDFDSIPLRFIPEYRFPKTRDILQICSSLVTLSSTDVLELSHFSVKEYLVGNITEPNIRRYSFNARIAHEFIARTCIAYLMQFTEYVDDIRPFPLALYAAEHWINHVGSAHTDALDDLAFDLLQAHSMVFVNWVRICDVDYYNNYTELSRPPHDIPTPLYYAAGAGFVRVSQKLLEHGADMNVHGGYYGNALQAASYSGHIAVVELLLEKGANVHVQGGIYGNALQAASDGGYNAVVELLLKKGADVNAQGGKYGTALHVALYKGHKAVVELLLDKGAKMHVQGGFYDALQMVSFHGHDTVVELLLKKGANVNVQGGDYGNALQAASKGSHITVVERLLEKGADVNAQSGRYGNALQAASVEGHNAVVELLLEKGANVNVQGGRHGNALQAASLRGHKAVVELLLEKGADVNAQGDEFGNALQAASFCGDDTIVEWLLEKGANVNAQGGDYRNALQAASLRGHEAVVILLLAKGADVNAQGSEFGNALQAASLCGDNAIVEWLLEKGANVNAQGGDYGNALQAASGWGHIAVVELLLKKGAYVNAQGGNYGNALQAASYGGHKAVVELLLEKGADMNAQGGEYRTALQAASRRGHKAIEQLLLEKRAAQDVSFWNATSHARISVNTSSECYSSSSDDASSSSSDNSDGYYSAQGSL